VRNYAPPSTTWQPAESQVRLVPPQEPPQTAQAAPPAGVEEKRTSEPPVADTQGSPSPALPVGIAQFAYARGQIATGLRPMLEGFDWLQAQGYKTVLNVHKPGEDDAADRRMFEKRGMKYLSLEVSPQTLGKGTVDTFNRIVEESERPLFVYDRDGVLAGGLWYLHFRTAGKLSDEEARSRAGRLGLKTDADGDARTMWVAIQKLLSEQQ